MKRLEARRMLEDAQRELAAAIAKLDEEDEFNADDITNSVKTVASVLKAVRAIDKADRPSIITKYRSLPVTGTNLALYWRDLLVAYHPSMGMITPLNVKDKAQLSRMYEKVTDIHERMHYIVQHWEKYVEHCKEFYGAFPLPKYPTIGFMVKYLQGVHSFYGLQLTAIEVEKKPTTTTKSQTPKWSKTK